MTYEGIYNKYYIRMPKIVAIIWGALLAVLGLVEVGIATEGFADRVNRLVGYCILDCIRHSVCAENFYLTKNCSCRSTN